MISKYLKEYFKERKVTQHEIARRTKIAHSKVNLALNGKRKLSAEELILIAKIYNINLNKLKEIK